MAKVIIGIHGLGNKPPKNLLESWWQMAIEEGLRKWKNEIPAYTFELVYWADILHENPLDENCTDKEDPLFLDEKYIPSSGNYLPDDHTRRKKILDFLGREMNSIFLNDDFSLNYSFLTDAIVRHFFTDLDKYYKETLDVKSSKNVKELIRQRTAEMIRKHQKDEILIIAHSMGSIIAYDVLVFDIPDITIDTLITIGSPLGLPVVKSKIAAERRLKQKDAGNLTAPSNIKKHWFNFSDLEDKVAINYRLSDDYTENASQVKPIDFEVHNDYEMDGEPNPHKSYGYLRTQEFSDKLYIFLTTKKPTFWKRIFNKLGQLLKLQTATEY